MSEEGGNTQQYLNKILNKQEQTTAARERLGKHVSAATDTKINGVICAVRAEKL
jgi:hypothetical protein